MNSQLNRVLFVCHGNICRSPMAQCVMQHLVDERGLGGRFIIDSAATTADELGNPIYPPARRMLEARGVPVLAHRARLVARGEDAQWDHIICMDDENMRHLRRILGAGNCGNVRKLMSLVGQGRDVADPWYTRDFDTTFDDIMSGCTALLDELA